MITQATHTPAPLERLRHHVSGAISRGEAVPVVEVSAPATHTPGPWEIGSINKRDKSLWWSAVFTPKSTGKFHTPRACEALGVDREECEANARLIAAAPDLLQALKNAREWLDELAGLVQSGAFDAAEDWTGANAVSVDSSLAEVIAKAEGRTE